MLKPSRIDDPFEASLNAWPEEAENEAGETAIAAVGVLSELAGIFGNIRDRFRNESRFARFNYLLEGARLKFAQLEGRVVQVVAELDQVKQGLASKEFREAATTAAEEAVRAVSLEKIDQFSSILVGSIDPALASDSPADASSLIRDIARLAPTDLKVLRHLEEAYGDLFPTYPNVHTPDPFTERIQGLKDAIHRSGLHQEEFQSVCERLRGFGLAAEVLRNNSRMQLSDYCYRPTRRGLKLLKLLGSSAT